LKPVELEKLEWPILLETLAAFSQTDDGQTLCLELQPSLDRAEIEARWADVSSLKEIVRQGYRPPIGDLPPMRRIFRALGLGQILGGVELRQVLQLLQAIQKVHGFCVNFAAKSETLARLKNHIYPVPKLMTAIDKAVSPDGTLLDDASPELSSIRRKKISLAKKIEDQIKKVLRESSVEQYLQDDFFTVRNERYVVPIRLDGRGRVAGTIIDTSDSGQTLFLEPSSVAPLNAEWLENQLAEKLEILRIFRTLSGLAATELDTMRVDYDELIQLDFMTAQAGLAIQLDANPVELTGEPVLDLRAARHPLIRKAPDVMPVATTEGVEAPAEAVPVSLTRMKNTAVPNTISLSGTQRCLIISGPNAGGKTVVLKTVGILHVMAKAGLLIPADRASRMFLFDNIFLELGDAQNLAASLSTFSGHVLGLKPILEKAGSNDLALLDELAVGTEPQTGSALAQAVLETLATRDTTTLATTHYDSLKGLASVDSRQGTTRFRNGSMEYSLKTMRPTYKLILDVPGQSYGLEVASQIGLPASVIERAKSLRGTSASTLEHAINQLLEAREETENIRATLRQKELAAEEAMARLESERKALDEARREAARKAARNQEDEIEEMRESVRDLQEQLKAALKSLRKAESGNIQQAIETASGIATTSGDKMRQFDQKTREIIGRGREGEVLPGRTLSPGEALRTGQKVFVVPLRKEGQILKPAEGDTSPAEVQVGLVKLRVPAHDLRILQDAPAPGQKTAHALADGGGAGARGKAAPPPKLRPLNPPPEIPALVLQTPTNTLDLRGLDADTAVSRTLDFIDKALLRGEGAIVLVHGHGTDKLKNAIRRSLRGDCPYNISFRPGETQEGGDGVTIVALKG
jgi:DNA mismatch repair protein MutS2